MEKIDVLVLLDIEGLEDQEKFDNHILSEGFKVVSGEKHVYTGESTTSTFSTKAYILEVFKKALQMSTFNSCSMVFLLNETPYPSYKYDKTTNDFEEVK